MSPNDLHHRSLSLSTYRRLVFTTASLAIIISLATVAEAQPSATTSKTADLSIKPRIGVGANSPSSGAEGNFHFESFIPLWQKPEASVLFFEGRLLLDEDSNTGGNLLFGYREYNERLNRTFGGHLGFDIRNTEDSTFHQLGIGAESLGKDVDLHLNSYWPVGTIRNQVEERTFDTGLQLQNEPRFVGNALLLDLFRERQTSRSFEEAIASIEFDLGKQLHSFDNGGELRAYVGPYLLHSSTRGNALGGRLRLQIEPTPNITAGLGIQHDGFFDTHILGNIRFNFPGNRPQQVTVAENPVISRMGASVHRNHSIIVDQQTEVEVQRESRTEPAINPDTGEPWFFNHVNLGLGNSDGSIESPFATVAEALAATQGDGNDIVYVAQGTNPGIPAFSIPDNVRVVSRGVLRNLPIAPFTSELGSSISRVNLGSVTLPDSGNGESPLITGTVTMGNNTLLSGFTINPNGDNAIEATDVGNITIDQNRIINADDGISLNNITGDVVITKNRLSQIEDDGIDIDLDNTTLNSVLISDNRVTNFGDEGIDVDAANNSNISLVTIANNTVTDTETDSEDEEAVSGINITADENSLIDVATISGNTVTTNKALADGIFVWSDDGSIINSVFLTDNIVTTAGNFTEGIFILSDDASLINEVTLSGNSVTTTGEIDAFGITVAAVENSTIGTASLSSNTVLTSGDSSDGIFVEADDSTINTAEIFDNTVSTSGPLSNGIFALASNSPIDTVEIFGNTVSTSGDFSPGIRVWSVANSVIDTVAISDNIVTTAGIGGHGIFVLSLFDSAINAVTISGNTVTTSGDDAYGMFVDSVGSSEIDTLTITENTISTSGDDAFGINIRSIDDSVIDTTTITGNTISTSGTDADGIFIQSLLNSLFNTINLTDNLFLQAGRDSVRINIMGSDSNPVCLAISGNQSNDPAVTTAGGTDFNLISNGVVFQVVNLNNVSANNNNGTFSFDGVLVPPNTAPAPFTNVPSCS